jgi:maltose alpha-D-glucosyltransferase / alpha-amylase
MNADLIGSEVSTETEEEKPFALDLSVGEIIGRRTAEMHRALAVPTENQDFAAEKTTRQDLEKWVTAARAEVDEMLEALKTAAIAEPLGEASDLAEKLLGQRKRLMSRLGACLGMKPSGGRTRIHGDYHLGQLLVAQNDIYVIDFEGEPRRSIEERREKTSPLRDVAGMLRSIDYVAAAAVRQQAQMPPGQENYAAERAASWRWLTIDQFLKSYRETMEGSPVAPTDADFERAVLDLFLIQKAAYEILYELANRPSWVDIPLAGLMELIADEEEA